MNDLANPVPVMTRLDALNEQIASLQSERDALLEKERAATVEWIKAEIQKFGLTVADLGLVQTEEMPTKKERSARAVYRDTVVNQEYRGGKIPSWLQARLLETALSYPEYRDAYMERVN